MKTVLLFKTISKKNDNKKQKYINRKTKNEFKGKMTRSENGTIWRTTTNEVRHGLTTNSYEETARKGKGK